MSSSTVDLNENLPTFLSDCMLAHATEWVYEKANEDKSSSAVTSMISIQTSDYYVFESGHSLFIK